MSNHRFIYKVKRLQKFMGSIPDKKYVIVQIFFFMIAVKKILIFNHPIQSVFQTSLFIKINDTPKNVSS